MKIWLAPVFGGGARRSGPSWVPKRSLGALHALFRRRSLVQILVYFLLPFGDDGRHTQIARDVHNGPGHVQDTVERKDEADHQRCLLGAHADCVEYGGQEEQGGRRDRSGPDRDQGRGQSNQEIITQFERNAEGLRCKDRDHTHI